MSKHRRPHGRHSGPTPKLLPKLPKGSRELTAEEALAAEVISLTEQLAATQAKLEATDQVLQQRNVDVANLNRVLAMRAVGVSPRVAALREKYRLPVNFSSTVQPDGRTVLTSPDAPAPVTPEEIAEKEAELARLEVELADLVPEVEPTPEEVVDAELVRLQAEIRRLKAKLPPEADAPAEAKP